MNRQGGFSIKLGLLLLALLAASFTVGALALQDEEEDEQRKIWNKQISDARKKAGATPAPPPGKRPPRAAGDDLVGVTFWRLQPASKPASAKEEEDKPRLLVQKDGKTAPMTPQRVASGTEFDKNDTVRLSIEVPREGENYLYVIDREIYKDGKLSDPYLIFPNTRTRGGNNKVMGGQIVDLPAATDDPPYFNFTSNNPAYAGEQLTIIVSPEKLDMPPIGEGPVALDKKKVEEWERLWSGKTDVREARKSEGREWTKDEKAAAEGKRLLTQGPLPQTIYRVAASTEGKLLFTVKMRVRSW